MKGEHRNGSEPLIYPYLNGWGPSEVENLSSHFNVYCAHLINWNKRNHF